MNNRIPEPYGSASDLPSVVEMRSMLKGLKHLTRFVGRSERQGIVEAEKELDAFIDLVEHFYRVFGPRHWIFTDHLPMTAIRELLGTDVPSDQLELGLVEIVAKQISSPNWHIGLLKHEALDARRANLECARRHYLDSQWGSCTLVLITVMDGFVNDVDQTDRRGLHAREPNEMTAWDRISGHHMGLTSVMRVFLKTFKRRYDDEVFEVHRHGIVHGVVVNYNNAIVATKAWNLLAAVADWADAKQKAAVPVEPMPGLREILSSIGDHAHRENYSEEFAPSSFTDLDAEFASIEVVKVANRFLESWEKNRWGLVAEALPTRFGAQRREAKTRAVEAKQIYQSTVLESFEVTGVVFPQASVALTRGSATIDGEFVKISIRWISERANGKLAIPGDSDSQWVLAQYPPKCFVVHNGS